GAIDVPVLGSYIPEAINARLTGATAWKARVLSGSQGTEVTVTSDLKGLGSTLPAPGNKAADDARPLTLRIDRLGTENELTTAALDGGLYWRSSRFGPGGAERWQVALKLGAPVSIETPRDGLWLYGEAAALDVDAWLAVFSQARRDAPPVPVEGAPPGIELRGIDVRAERVRYLGRDFTQLAAHLE